MSDELKLRAEHVRKEFRQGRQEILALADVTMGVRANEFITIVGTTGCGKSTFLNIVAGLEQPSGGLLTIDGKPVAGPGLDRGMVFQTYSLFPWQTVLRNVEFGLGKKGMGRRERREVARQHIDMVGLSGFEHAYPAQLSGGMQQRVAIARALAYDPSLLLMDEPFGALDAQTRGLMQELLLRIWEQHKTTVLFITHDVDEAIFLADRLYVMTARPGRIKTEISVELERPRPYELQTAPEFIVIKREVMQLIREESLRSTAEREEAGSLEPVPHRTPFTRVAGERQPASAWPDNPAEES
jgi:ABC-type nitrate/sulfonate/bicarbonate transport system ATPase subunit